MHEYLLDFIIIFFLLIINGILAMTELAIVASKRNKIASMVKKSEGAQAALELIDNPASFLATVQIGITIIGIIAGAFSGQEFAKPLGLWLNNIEWIYGRGNVVAFIFVVLGMTYVSLVIGELIPKRIALAQPEKVAIFFARPVRLFSRLTYVFVLILDFSTKFLLRFLGQKEVKESIVTEEEIHSMITQGLEEGAIDAFEHQVFQKVLQFGNKEASIMMTPRIKVVLLDLEDSIEENKNKILTNPHRYYPVFAGTLDNFMGIIDTKDVLTQQMKGITFDLKPLIKEAPCVIEGNLGPDLVDQFIKYQTHIAIVMNEYGSMQGIVTLVDIFETLIGIIPESYQNKHYKTTLQEDGSWLCDGLTPIDEIEVLLQVNIINSFEDNNFDTLAGFLLVHFKHIPMVGEQVEWDEFTFEIIEMDGIRVDKVLIQKKAD